jgi:hypothetical protein
MVFTFAKKTSNHIQLIIFLLIVFYYSLSPSYAHGHNLALIYFLLNQLAWKFLWAPETKSDEDSFNDVEFEHLEDIHENATRYNVMGFRLFYLLILL